MPRQEEALSISDQVVVMYKGIAEQAGTPFEIYNVGRSDPVSVNALLELLEQATGRTARRQELGLQPGDVARTFASTAKLAAATGFSPRVALPDGLARFVDWFRYWQAR